MPPARRAPRRTRPAGHAAATAAATRRRPRAGRSAGQLGGRARSPRAASGMAPRALARAAASSSSRRTSSSGRAPAAARCQARRSACFGDAERDRQRAVRGASLVRRRALVTAERTREWWNSSRQARTATRRACSAASRAVPSDPSAAAACRMVESRPVSSAAATSSSPVASPPAAAAQVEEVPLDALGQRQRGRQRLRAGELAALSASEARAGRGRLPGVLTSLVAHVPRNLAAVRAARKQLLGRVDAEATELLAPASGASKWRAPSSRAANSSTIPSASSRRATKSSASADGASSQCRVVGEGRDRPSLGERGQQLQHRDRDEEAVIPGPVAEAECAAQGSLLRRRQRPPDRRGRAERACLQRRERQLRPGLDAPRWTMLQVRRSVAGVLEQGRLADARLAAEREDTPFATPAPRRAARRSARAPRRGRRASDDDTPRSASERVVPSVVQPR